MHASPAAGSGSACGGGEGRKGGKGGYGPSRRQREIAANLKELAPLTRDERQALRPPPRLKQFAQREPNVAELLGKLHEDEQLWFTLLRHVNRDEATRLLEGFTQTSTWADDRLHPTRLAKWHYNRTQKNNSDSRATSRCGSSVASTSLDEILERLRALELQ